MWFIRWDCNYSILCSVGIWPESASFRDEHMDNPPPRWRGICQAGENFDHSHCNRLIKFISCHSNFAHFSSVICLFLL